MKDQAASTVSDEDFAKRAERWPKDTPDTKEAYFIRDIFDCKSTPIFLNNHYQNLIPNFSLLAQFPSQAAADTAVRWIPRGDWGCSSDPSGRAVSIHTAAYEAES